MKTLSASMILALICFTLCGWRANWGFFAHKKINRLAVFTLPPEMIGFYKANITYITESAVNPDKRRYVVPEEAPRHYLDADHYGDSVFQILPHRWDDAVERFTEDTLQAYGVLPWHIWRMYTRLRDAFAVRDPARILKLSAELGHYIADAHVPLHTTENYNGQLTDQEGIHGFWESRLPEVFSDEYGFFVGRAEYIEHPGTAVWNAVAASHSLVEDVLREEKILGKRYGEKKFSFETRGNVTVRVYAMDYTRAYHRVLNGMVEHQMRAAVKMIGDFWFTAWVEAGQPDLQALIDYEPSEQELRENREALRQLRGGDFKGRVHEEEGE